MSNQREEHRIRAIRNCITELEQFLDEEQGWGLDEMTQAAFETAIESLRMRLNREVDPL